jgi:hypothetical protein
MKSVKKSINVSLWCFVVALSLAAWLKEICHCNFGYLYDGIAVGSW